MIFEVVEIMANRPIDVDTEIKFAIASARADKKELLRFDIKREDEDFQKTFNTITRVLKRMKSAGQIQFIATPKSFDNSNAEAEFLINKYPAYLENIPSVSDTEAFIFVKL